MQQTLITPHLAAHGSLPPSIETMFQFLLTLLFTMLNSPNAPFVALFTFRYLRLIVHLVAFWLYKPTFVPADPSLTPEDCTIVIPTVEPDNPDFHECLQTVLVNGPGAVLIVTVGRNNLRLANQIVAPYQAAFPSTKISVSITDIANKRHQVCHALPQVQTDITVLVDDHVFWPSANFLPTILAPFEDPQVGVVGTNKRVRRCDTGFGIRSFWNMIGALYLERHNFEIRSTNAVDGGVFVVSGRTAAHRTCILQDPAFINGFLHERFFFGKFGPLNADDDNFITRWEVSHGWKIKIQYSQDAMIETTLGTYPKFLSQCLRWVRTTWRSNSASLFTDRTVWTAQPWCVYAVYITSFFNFALFYDAALLYTVTSTTYGTANMSTALSAMAAWIVASKMVKLTPYFLRHPRDLIYLPGYFVFAYFHSLIKLYAGLTFYVTAWGGRDLAAIGDDDNNNDDHDDGHEDGNDHFSPRPSPASSVSQSSSSSGSSLSSGGVALPDSDANPSDASDIYPELSSWNHLFSISSWRPAGLRQVFTNGISAVFNTPWGSVSARVKSYLVPANILHTQMSLSTLDRTPKSVIHIQIRNSRIRTDIVQNNDNDAVDHSPSSPQSCLSLDDGADFGNDSYPTLPSPPQSITRSSSISDSVPIESPIHDPPNLYPSPSSSPSPNAPGSRLRKRFSRNQDCQRLHSTDCFSTATDHAKTCELPKTVFDPAFPKI